MADGPVSLVLLLAAQAEAHVGSAAITQHQGHGNGHDGQRESHVGGSHTGNTHTLPHEDLVHDVVQIVHHEGHGGGDGITAEESADGFRFQRVLLSNSLFHEVLLSFCPRRRKKSTLGAKDLGRRMQTRHFSCKFQLGESIQVP